jgi:DNA-binding transcriptional MerR regulator
VRLRIDELAARTGVTSRNIRAYREKGLLPAPELEGRTGYYTEEHVQRLAIIEDLQRRGFSLEAIRQTLEAWSVGGDFRLLVGLQTILTSPFHSEEPASVSVPELLGRFPEAATDPSLVERAVALGLVEEGDGERLAVPSPTLLDAGTELVAVGVPLAAVLDVFERVSADMADVAARFVGLVEQHLVDADELTRPQEGQPAELVERVQRLRPLAMEVIRPILARQLTREVDRAVRRIALAVEGGGRQAEEGEADGAAADGAGGASSSRTPAGAAATPVRTSPLE